VSPEKHGSTKGTAAGAGIGVAVGGVGGLLAGLGTFAIPGIGPVVGAGWLATTLIGAMAGGAAGGIVGSLTEAGIAWRETRNEMVGLEHRDPKEIASVVKDLELEAATENEGSFAGATAQAVAPTVRKPRA
jgi:hypothetical protein